MASKLPALADLYAERVPGHCLICDEPLPPRNPHVGARPRVLCHDPDCAHTFKIIYERAYKKSHRAGVKLSQFTGHVEKPGRLLW